MRAVVQLNDYDPEDGQPDDEHCSYDPHHDPRSVVNGVETEWFEGSGNLHVTDDDVEEVSEMVDGDVIIILEDSVPPHHRVENAELVTVRAD